MGEAARKRISYQQYLEIEEETGIKHEFLDGFVYAMAGGTVAHAILVLSVNAELRAALRGRTCRATSSEQKVIIPATGLATYPDGSVYCGGMERHPEDRHALTNPTLLSEVLSESSEAWDRGGKFQNYRQIPTLRYYLLFSQRDVRVELHTLTSPSAWQTRVFGPGEEIPLPALQISLSVDAIYAEALEEMQAELERERAEEGPPRQPAPAR